MDYTLSSGESNGLYKKSPCLPIPDINFKIAVIWFAKVYNTRILLNFPRTYSPQFLLPCYCPTTNLLLPYYCPTTALLLPYCCHYCHYCYCCHTVPYSSCFSHYYLGY